MSTILNSIYIEITGCGLNSAIRNLDPVRSPPGVKRLGPIQIPFSTPIFPQNPAKLSSLIAANRKSNALVLVASPPTQEMH
jgi:hypothetical protein